MSLAEMFFLAVGLAMDAFAVSICKGLSLGETKMKHSAIAGLYFGGFQAGNALFLPAGAGGKHQKPPILL